MKIRTVKDLLEEKKRGENICIKGWVRTRRGSKNVSFIALNDGSTIKNIQIVAETNIFDDHILKNITTGAAISVIGKICDSKGLKQNIEILASKIEILGVSDSENISDVSLEDINSFLQGLHQFFSEN